MKKTTKLRLLAIALTLVVVAAALVSAELLIQWSVFRSSTERRDHVWEPEYMPIKFKSNYKGVFWKVPFRTNKYGFRDEPDFDLKPAPGTFRIISHGDSIGFGLGIPASAHYTKVIERELNSSARNRNSGWHYDVVNAAGQGYSPSGYYAYMLNEGQQLGMNMMIVDMEMCTAPSNEALLYWEKSPNKPPRLRGGRYVVGWDGNMLATCSLGGYFFEKTYLYTDLLHRTLNLMQRISPSEPFAHQGETGVSYYNLGFDQYVLTEKRLKTGWDNVFYSLKGLQEICRKRKIPFLLLIFPSQYMFDEATGPWHSYATQLMQRGVARAKQEGLVFLDLTEPVRKGGGKDLYFDFAHMTAEGNRVVGEAIFKRLADQLLGPAPADSTSAGSD